MGDKATDNVQRETDQERFLQQYLKSPKNLELFIDLRNQGLYRFPVNLDVLRRENAELVNDLIKNPVRFLSNMQATVNDMGPQQLDGGKKNMMDPQKESQFKISFEGNLGRNHVTPRGLSANLVNQLVGVQGIVTRMSLVRPKLMKAVQYCDVTNLRSRKNFTDSQDPAEETQLDYSTVVPRKDEAGNSLTMEYGRCVFRDCQTIIVQELPERTPTGLLPRSVEVILEQDLVDSAKPGDRITVIGVFKCFANMGTMGDGNFKSALLGLSVHKLTNDTEDQQLSPTDLTLIKTISNRPDILEYISKSIAPSIYGHEEIKKAVLLMLLGGSEKNLSTGTHLRGDINMLFIGDPSTAKSQMLRYIMTIAPLSITTTGRGSSSVGLTAAVRRDQESGENVLEAGAMVLADGGVVLIDEFDKMDEVDRVAIHEVMEQQTVTIAKAGIHCSLNARCSVVAAANPIYGEYQKDLPPTKNIGLPDSLLSRFDLLFIVLDLKREDIDRKVAERVTKNHRYRGPGDNQGQSGQQDSFIITQTYQIKQEQGPYVSFQSNLYSATDKDLLSQSFLKKYITYAKKLITQTVLDDESINVITLEWVAMRQQDLTSNTQVRILPITIRSLESLIRLASAHAKLRLSNKVTVQDCRVAIQLMRFTLYADEPSNIDDNENEDNDNDNDDDKGAGGRNMEKVEQMEQEYQSKKKESHKKEKVTPKKEVQTKEFEKRESAGKKQEPVAPKIKKIKTDDEGLSLQMRKLSLGKVTVTEQQKKKVFKAILDYQTEMGQNLVSFDMVQVIVEREFPLITQQVFLKALLELEGTGKLYLDLDKGEVQLF